MACGAAILLMTVLLIGAEPATRGPTRWEYGIYIESPNQYEWQGQDKTVRANNPTSFFEQMGFPTSIEVNARTARVSPLLLNHLGRQGWELVHVAIDSRYDTYWFKRPR